MTDHAAAERAVQLEAALARLPRCPLCTCPCIDGHEERVVSAMGSEAMTSYREFLQCVSCHHIWEDSQALALVGDVRRRCPMVTLPADVLAVVRADQRRLRELYEGAGKRLPKWLLRSRPEWELEARREEEARDA